MFKQGGSAGQSLIELIIGITLGVIIIGGVSASIFVGMRSNLYARQELAAAQLGQRTIDYVRLVAEADWNALYRQNKGSAHSYHVAPSGANLVIRTGVNSVVVDGLTYTYFFQINNVSRGANGAIVASGGTNDPSTQEISVRVNWESLGSPREVIVQGYVMRVRNESPRFTDWSLGPGAEGPVTSPNRGYSSGSNINHTSAGSVRIQEF